MKETIIAAALKEMEIHSLRFTMEDLTRRLHIGRNFRRFIFVRLKKKIIKVAPIEGHFFCNNYFGNHCSSMWTWNFLLASSRGAS